MDKIRYSELFYSVQGEGRFVGVPSVFLRTFGCNFECRGFGQPRGQLIPVEQMPHNLDPRADENHPQAYKSFQELPVTNIGCDTSASWSMKYKHLAAWKNVDELAKDVTAMTPWNSWHNKETNQDVHLVLTGGEPLMWQKQIISLLRQPEFLTLRNLTIETNATYELKDDFYEFLSEELQDERVRTPVHITWSCSPKLTISGEKWEDAIKPEVVDSYFSVLNSYLYLKFVVADEQDLEDVHKAVAAYKAVGVEPQVFLMPCGATQEGQAKTSRQVAELCMKEGWSYSPRLHVDLFGNAWGT
jgi:7-carboxy-7-deazaguanine synthase